jgi:glycosyltransferase involved in cell wall biosynthesis
MAMDMTVAICTRNRAGLLDRALASIAAMEVPGDIAWELIVVDNNSSDATAKIIEKYRGPLPIRGEFEGLAGLSNARNRAVAAAKGAYILWTDDDVVVDRGWLSAYRDAFRRWPQAALFGGKVLPQLDEPVPQWLAECFPLVRDAFAYRDFGAESLALSIEEWVLPYGANYAMRMSEQQAHLYDPELGAAPGRSRLGEEMEVIRALLKAGKTGYWVPQSIVYHRITRARQTLKQIGRFYEAAGETDAFQARVAAKGEQHSAMGLLRRTLRRAWQYELHRLISPPEIWIRAYMQYCKDWGSLRYRLRQAMR